jgi:hypothetical protein
VNAVAEAVTLATEVVVQRSDGSVRMRDIPVVITTSRGYTDLCIDRPTLHIGLRLSGAERIALIEALGGHV